MRKYLAIFGALLVVTVGDAGSTSGSILSDGGDAGISALRRYTNDRQLTLPDPFSSLNPVHTIRYTLTPAFAVAGAPMTELHFWSNRATVPGTWHTAGHTTRRPDVISDIVRSGVPGLYPGAVALVVRSGACDEPIVVGDAVRYSSYDTELPADERVPMRADTIFDIASLTKLFTATVVLSLVDDGALSLSDKASRWLPELDDRITVRHLLTHTSGLPAHIESWKYPDSRRAILTANLTGAPGTVFEYSCLGYISAGWIAEAIAGKPLAELVIERVCRPLGLSDTGFWPTAVDRIAATEYEPYVDRGMVRGIVHDENSWRLGGGVGNAGIFSTAADLARFGEMLLRGGAPILSDKAYTEMTTDQLPATLNPGYRQGIGPRIDDPSFMGSLAGSGALGHTGFTGTSLVVDRSRELVIVFLTNRVHPSRERSSVVEIRQQLADACR